MNPEGRELGELAERVARAAGDLLRDGRPEALAVASTKSSPTDVVTAMDLAAEELVRTQLRSARPDDGVLGEESGLVAGSSGLTWVVDPIDGTVNYLYGLPAYAVSVAVVRAPGAATAAAEPDPLSWEVLAGCVHNPASGETWTAVAGEGARLDGRLLPPLREVPLAQALVGTGFGYRADARAEQAAVVAGLLPRVRDLRRIGAASLDLCAVASGRMDAYYEWGLWPWDLAAGSLVLTEAGGVLRRLARPPGPDHPLAGRDTLVAGPPGLVDGLHAVLTSLSLPG